MKLPALLRAFLPNRSMPTRVLFGPFRGARVEMRPSESLRKIFGLYEHELNLWLEKVLSKVDTVLDVGANDGYFAFGCAEALRRLGRHGEIVAFEPQAQHCTQLRASQELQPPGSMISISVREGFVGREVSPGHTTLDVAADELGLTPETRRTLIKIDVEGAEMDVVAGASRWLRPENFFLIEVHTLELLDRLLNHFAASNLPIDRLDQRPLPLLGLEARAATNCWIVSRLSFEEKRSPRNRR